MLRDQPRATLPAKTVSTLPRLWLFTDERNDLVLEEAIGRLPRGSGIVFRHHHLPEPQRRKRFVAVKKLARRRGHLLVLAGAARMARRWGADGVHGRMVRRSVLAGLLHSAPVHDAGEIEQANRAGAGIFILSPVFVTRSHPGQRPLNCLQTRRLAALCNGPVICLGGMDARRYRLRKDLPVHGWAAIDALS